MLFILHIIGLIIAGYYLVVQLRALAISRTDGVVGNTFSGSVWLAAAWLVVGFSTFLFVNFASLST